MNCMTHLHSPMVCCMQFVTLTMHVILYHYSNLLSHPTLQNCLGNLMGMMDMLCHLDNDFPVRFCS